MKDKWERTRRDQTGPERDEQHEFDNLWLASRIAELQVTSDHSKYSLAHQKSRKSAAILNSISYTLPELKHHTKSQTEYSAIRRTNARDIISQPTETKVTTMNYQHEIYVTLRKPSEHSSSHTCQFQIIHSTAS